MMPVVTVGILNAGEIQIELNGIFYETFSDMELNGTITAICENGRVLLRGDCISNVFDKEVWLIPADPQQCSFKVFNVTIGIGFHWQKNEDQIFKGTLKIRVTPSGLSVINVIPVEDYLISVISSEMSANSSPELLKAHAVISRSWLLAQIEKGLKIKRKEDSYQAHFQTDDELVRWYDREDHEYFDVCADDHCQRYQGITRAGNPAVELAVRQTEGEVVVFADRLCDTRFSKCCGGITEKFENVWEPVMHPYLQRVYDNVEDQADLAGDLTVEENAKEWILSDPPAFCNNSESSVLKQVLNDYDQATHDFYRWRVNYTGKKLGELIKSKTGIDFGAIRDLVPIQRGVSGRLIKLKVIGTNRTMTIGKELEIRKALSPTHLYSSAFTVERKEADGDVDFTLFGAGWGHGVGLCQIGAAVMGSKGYNYWQILLHYFRGAQIRKNY